VATGWTRFDYHRLPTPTTKHTTLQPTPTPLVSLVPVPVPVVPNAVAVPPSYDEHYGDLGLVLGNAVWPAGVGVVEVCSLWTSIVLLLVCFNILQ
jgi:hypothetical protein